MRSSDVRFVRRSSVFAFVVAVMMVIAVMEVGLRRVENSYTKKRRMLESRASEIDVIVTGPSGALFGIDPSVIGPHAVNLGDVSQSLYYDTELVKRYLPRLPKLRTVVFTVGLFAFEYSLADTPEYWRQFWYQRFWDIPPERDEHSLDLRRFSTIALYPPKIRLKALIHAFHLDVAPEIDANGWRHLGDNDLGSVTEANALERAQYHASIMHPTYIASNERALAETIDRLHARGVATLLVVLPVHPLYVAHFSSAALLRLHAVLGRLASEHGAAVRDYATDSSFSADQFIDTDHLNARGAQRMSAIVARDVIEVAP